MNAEYLLEGKNRYVLVDSEIVGRSLDADLTRKFREDISVEGTRIIKKNHGVVWRIPYRFHGGTCFLESICVNMGSNGSTQLLLEGNPNKLNGAGARYVLERGNTELRYDHEGALLTLMDLWISFVEERLD